VILVDTSVWVEHLRAGSRALGEALHAGQVLTHPFVIGVARELDLAPF